MNTKKDSMNTKTDRQKYAAEYREAHREEASATTRAWYQEHKEYARKWRKRYNKRHKKEVAKYHARKAVKARKAELNKKRYQTSKRHRMLAIARATIRAAITAKNARTNTRKLRFVGCTVADFCAHLESLFEPGMSWSNMDKWQIDHVTPCNQFNTAVMAQLCECFAKSNIRPIWERDNRTRTRKPI